MIGKWLDLELSGGRPAPLREAAMTAIDKHRAFLHGADGYKESHSSVLNLQHKVNLNFFMISTTDLFA